MQYKREDFEEVNQEYVEGTKKVNIHATAAIFETVKKTVEAINAQL